MTTWCPSPEDRKLSYYNFSHASGYRTVKMYPTSYSVFLLFRCSNKPDPGDVCTEPFHANNSHECKTRTQQTITRKQNTSNTHLDHHKIHYEDKVLHKWTRHSWHPNHTHIPKSKWRKVYQLRNSVQPASLVFDREGGGGMLWMSVHNSYADDKIRYPARLVDRLKGMETYIKGILVHSRKNILDLVNERETMGH